MDSASVMASAFIVASASTPSALAPLVGAGVAGAAAAVAAEAQDECRKYFHLFFVTLD